MPRDTKPSKPDADSPTTDTKPYARSPNKNKKHQLFYGEKRTGAWTTQEDKLLFEMLYPKASGVNWEAVVQKVEGRDIKSCQNRLVVIQKRLDDFFKPIAA